MSMKFEIHSTGISDTGKKRTGNEDMFHCDKLWDDRYHLAVLIDGCGGYQGGKVCAEMTLQGILDYLKDHQESDKAALLKKAVVHANNLVHERRALEPELQRMCCVATAVLVEAEKKCFHLVHVGDTRLYAYADGRIIKLSHDHSPVGRDEELGVISEVEAMHHRHRNIIERAIGEKFLEEDTTYLETETFPMEGGLQWLLCSDGLTDMVTTAEITDILGKDIPLPEKAAELVNAANMEGGKDNITLVIIQAQGGNPENAKSMMNHYSNRLNNNQEPDFESILQHTRLGVGGSDAFSTTLQGMNVGNTANSIDNEKIIELLKPKKETEGVEAYSLEKPLAQRRRIGFDVVKNTEEDERPLEEPEEKPDIFFTDEMVRTVPKKRVSVSESPGSVSPLRRLLFALLSLAVIAILIIQGIGYYKNLELKQEIEMLKQEMNELKVPAVPVDTLTILTDTTKYEH